MKRSYIYLIIALVLVVIVGALVWSPDDNQARDMSFFVTSANPGRGADLGGLSGADAYCEQLASAAGAGGKGWRAYLSVVATGTQAAVNARDRIGNGPWRNYKGEVIANNLEELHSNNKISKQTALNENGEMVSGRGDQVNMHDILTGASTEGRVIATSTDTTCFNWTSSASGSAMLGHHDRLGLRDDEPSKSWNSSHFSRGCSLEALRSTGGEGLMYCFATR